MMKIYFVYIISNQSHSLYTGVTNSLATRIPSHKAGTGSKFTSRYHFTRLVHFEEYSDVRMAIAREKQIKAWRRSKKIELIQKANPRWLDLSDSGEMEWFRRLIDRQESLAKKL